MTLLTRSREHVIAKWLLRHYKIGNYVITPRIEEAGEVSYRRHQLGAFQLEGVCSECNNGWMSALEVRAKPLLLSLSDGSRRLGDLSHGEQATLSRWTTKTAFVLHAAAGFIHQTVPIDSYPVLRTHPRRLPPGVSVFALQTPDLADDIPPVTAFQSMDWQAWIRGGPPDERLETIKISIRIGILQLLVAYLSDPAWSIVTWKNVHFPLWPTRIGLTCEAGLRHNFVKVRKETGTVLFNVSLVMAWGLSQADVDMTDRPAIEKALEDAFRRLGGEVVRANYGESNVL